MKTTVENRHNNSNNNHNNQNQGFNPDRIVRPLLKALGRCHDVQIACKLMEQLHRILFGDNIGIISIGTDHDNRDIDDLSLDDGGTRNATHISLKVADSIFRCNGFAVLLIALQHFGVQTTAVICWASRIFTTVTGIIPLANRHFVQLGGLRTLLLLSMGNKGQQQGHRIKCFHTYSNMGRASSITMRLEYIMKANFVGLIYNLISNLDYESLGKEAATRRCLDLVISILQTYPANVYVQEWGIRYLTVVGEKGDPQENDMLRRKRVRNIFATALDDRFRDRDDGHDDSNNKHMKKVAQVD